MAQISQTDSSQPLLDYFSKLIPLNQTEKDLVKDKFKPHLFLKRQFALQHGDVCEYFDFVVRGCLRLYKVDEKGDLRWSRKSGHKIKPKFVSFYGKEKQEASA